MLNSEQWLIDRRIVFVFFFKQKTAYEMRISDWSSDVCSSDLLDAFHAALPQEALRGLQQRRKDFRVVDGAQAAEMSRRRHAGRAGQGVDQIGRASCRERVCQYV